MALSLKFGANIYVVLQVQLTICRLQAFWMIIDASIFEVIFLGGRDGIAGDRRYRD